MLKNFITNVGILKKCMSINRLLNKLENSESAELSKAITINAITIVKKTALIILCFSPLFSFRFLQQEFYLFFQT